MKVLDCTIEIASPKIPTEKVPEGESRMINPVKEWLLPLVEQPPHLRPKIENGRMMAEGKMDLKSMIKYTPVVMKLQKGLEEELSEVLLEKGEYDLIVRAVNDYKNFPMVDIELTKYLQNFLELKDVEVKKVESLPDNLSGAVKPLPDVAAA